MIRAARLAQELLQAFVGVLSQPFRQDLDASTAAAGTAVFLSIAVAGGAFLTGGLADGLNFAVVVFVAVLLWIVATAIFVSVDKIKLALARNLSVVSFWITVTLIFLLAAEAVTVALNQAGRKIGVTCLLVLLIPFHMLRNLSLGVGLTMTVALWATTLALVWR